MCALRARRSRASAPKAPMPERFPYPPSFPNEREERFLSLVLAHDADVPRLWDAWKRDVRWDDIEPALIGLLPLLHLRLAALGIEDDLSARVRGIYKLAWFKNQKILEAARDVASACAKLGIPTLMLKGIALLDRAYADPGARFLGDGDFLIRPEDAHQVFSLMRQKGWRHVDTHFAPGRPERAFGYDAVMHATPMVGKNGVELEVHWRIFHVDTGRETVRLLLLRAPRHIERTDELWQRAEPLTLRGTPCCMLSLEDTLIHIVVHGAEGNPYRPARWVADAVTLIRREAPRWERLAAYTKEAGREIEMAIGMRYLMERFGIDVPDAFFASLDIGTVASERADAYYQTARAALPPLGNLPILWYRYWKLESSGGFINRCLRLPGYLARAWKLAKLRDIVPFVLGKYRARFARANG